MHIGSRGAILKVAIDATPLLASRTGVRVFCEEALAALSKREELEVSAFAVTWRRRQWLLPVVPAGVNVIQRPMPARPINQAWRLAGVPPIEWFVGAAQVVHGTNYTVPPTHRAKRIVTVHDLTPLRHPELCDDRTPSFPALLRRAIARGAWVHTPSVYVAGEVVEAFGADPERVRAVHHGIPSESAGEPDEGGTCLELPQGTSRYVVAVGTIEPRKDYPGLVRAFERLGGDHRDLALVIVGPEGWGTAALQEVLARSPVRDRVVRLGFVPDASRRRVVSGASVLAYTSLYEGFGFPPLEAMQAGVPVVATSAGAVPEVVGDAALLVPPGDPDASADALVRVLDDEDLRRSLVDRGHKRASLFSWQASAEGLSRLYSDAAAD